MGGGFMAGTLVHTRAGLVPIENIKAGDWVLSQPEQTGEPTYKQVVNTFQHEDKEVMSVQLCPSSEIALAKQEKRMWNEDKFLRLIGTSNHPFWMKCKGWTRADLLGERAFPSGRCGEVQLANGEWAEVLDAKPIFRTVKDGIGWITLSNYNDSGATLDLRQGAGVVESVRMNSDLKSPDSYYNMGIDVSTSDNFLRCSVYNLEVSDFHTYYVGTAGVWVHGGGST